MQLRGGARLDQRVRAGGVALYKALEAVENALVDGGRLLVGAGEQLEQARLEALRGEPRAQRVAVDIEP